MKKTIILVMILVLLATGTTLVIAGVKGKNITEVSKEAEIERLEKGTRPVINGDTLIACIEDKKIGILRGRIPADTPKLTLQKAIEILEGITEEEKNKTNIIVIKFNEYAGAPDYSWGSGMDYRTYIVDEEKGLYLNVVNGAKVYYWTPEGKTEIYSLSKGMINKP